MSEMDDKFIEAIKRKFGANPSEHLESAEFTSAKCDSCEWSGFYNETTWTFPSDPPGPYCPKCGSICTVLEIA
jgi:hypothetical protein